MRSRVNGRALSWACPGLCVLALLAGACGSRDEAPVASPNVIYRGCATVSMDGTCGISEETVLTLWVDAQPDAVRFVRGGRPDAEAAPEEVDGGTRFEIRPALADGRLEIVVEDPLDGAGRWSVDLAPSGVPGWWTEATEEIGRTGDLAAFRARLEAAAEEAPECERPFALGTLARIERNTGSPELAESLAEESFRRHLECGEAMYGAYDGTFLSYLYRERGAFEASRAVLERVEPAALNAYVRHLIDLELALLANDQGDLRAALRPATWSARSMVRLGRPLEHLRIGQVQASALQRLGRWEEAIAVFEGLEETAFELEGDEETRGLLLVNHGWALLLGIEAGRLEEDPAPYFRRALDLFDPEAPEQRSRIENATYNLALAHFLSGRGDEAAALLAGVRSALDEEPAIYPPVLHAWTLDLEARFARVSGDRERALALYAELGRLADASASPDGRWRALLGLAQTRSEGGEVALALERYAEAEALLDDWSLRAPVHEGRELFLAQRERGTREYLALLLARERPGDAAEVARAAIARASASLADASRLSRLPAPDREEWERERQRLAEARDELERLVWISYHDLTGRKLEAALAALEDRRAEIARRWDELGAELGRPDSSRPAALDPAALEPGTVRLVFHPLPDGWAGFESDVSGVAARRFQLPEGTDPAALAGALLGPFDGRLRGAERIEIVTHAGLAGVDLHALEVGDAPLIERAVVTWGEGLGGASPSPRAGTTTTAVLVANPTGDLPAAEDESEEVAEALSAWTCRRLVGAEAGGPSVREALAGADLLHYAGHAVAAGLGGWESELPLAPPTRLTVGDILAGPPAPRWVVLSGCETGGRVSRGHGAGSPASTMSLARAFLVAGSEEVVAAVRPVDDHEAAALVKALYEHWNPSVSLAEALRAAQLDLRANDPEADWSAFRAFVR